MLTRKQLDLLRFIHERMGECGIPPSFDEMKDALDLRSKSGIHRLIIALEERGFIRRLPNRARAIEVIRMPEIAKTPLSSSKLNASITSEKFPYSTNPKITANERPLSASERNVAINASSSGVSIPVMGRISAGTPISAIQNNSHSISLPPDLLTSGEHFALEVRGDSMVDAGILDGDTVILRRQDNADTGDIIVALIDDEEATLKRLRKSGPSIALEAANPAYETRVLGPDRVRIQGKLISLVRRY